MASPLGEIIGMDPQGMADALKEHIWGVQINGIMYDVMFTGVVSGNGILLGKVLRKSRTSQQIKIKEKNDAPKI